MMLKNMWQRWLKMLSKVISSYHNSKYKNFFDLSGGKYPPVPVPTRWNSNYMMSFSLINQREFQGLDLSKQWSFIEAYVKAFEPLYDCTVAIQRLDCTLSYFFGHWMTAYGRVASLNSNMFKEVLFEAMERREPALLNNNAMQAASYIDPRFSFQGSGLFSIQQKENIVNFLLKVHQIIIYSSKHSVDESHITPQLQTSTYESTPSATTNRFSLNDFLSRKLGKGTSTSGEISFLEQLIRSIQNQPRKNADENGFRVLDCWAGKRFDNPEIWKRVQVILGAAPTQCSVERDFSPYNFVFTTSRNLISGCNLENILKIRSNQSILHKALSESLPHDSK